MVREMLQEKHSQERGEAGRRGKEGQPGKIHRPNEVVVLVGWFVFNVLMFSHVDVKTDHGVYSNPSTANPVHLGPKRALLRSKGKSKGYPGT